MLVLLTDAMSRLSKCALIGVFTVLTLGMTVGATTINVPVDHATIQEAIDAASIDDTVLVAPGLYPENINFRGKDLVVTSHFALEQNTDYIYSTIIDGSSQTHPDTGSTVLMVSGEGYYTVLQGFTITGGSGTRHEWSPGNFDKMGGGVFVQGSYATIQYNYIRDNHMVFEGGLHAVGGGGIMAQNSYAFVYNNVIENNEGRYGAGMAVGFSTVYIKNNVIAYNQGGQTYGGSGIQINQGTTYIENNTIVGNLSIQPGGGVRAFGGTQSIKNNVIWYNEAPSSPQLYGIGTVDYCNVEGGWLTGTGNINLEPHLSADHWLYPYDDSPGIDAGDPSAASYDIEHPSHADMAYWPSYGGLRNDIGAYGGPGTSPHHLVGIYADTTRAWYSLDVSFEAGSRFECDEWTWYFGDGDSATGQASSHFYDQPGAYDVVLSMRSPEDTLVVVRENMIVVLADTLKADSIIGRLSDTLEITVHATNNVAVERLVIPVEYGGDCVLVPVSCSVEDCRTAGFGVDTLDMDMANHRFVVAVHGGAGQTLEVGNGAVLKLRFALSSSCTPGNRIPILVDGYDTWLASFEGYITNYSVPTIAGEIVLRCCGQYSGGITGNTNCSDDGKLTLSDISRLIDRVYISKESLCCEAGGNTNADPECKITLSDITVLIDAVYISRGDPQNCMPQCEK